MVKNWSSNSSNLLKSMIYLAFSFFFAFCLQVIVHELGHFFAGLIVGAKGGSVFLHPFLNSQVIFKSVPSTSDQVFIGVMGSVFDLLLASVFCLFAWKKRGVFSLPFLMWGALAFIGEGIGMLGNIAALPYSYDDIGQLALINISPKPLIPVCFLFIAVGLFIMVLLMPLSGVSPKDSFIKKVISYFCTFPLFFSISVLYLKIFNPDNINDLDIRLRQLVIGIVFSLLLALIYKPVDLLLSKNHKTREVTPPTRTGLVIIVLSGLVVFFSLITYSLLYN